MRFRGSEISNREDVHARGGFLERAVDVEIVRGEDHGEYAGLCPVDEGGMGGRIDRQGVGAWTMNAKLTNSRPSAGACATSYDLPRHREYNEYC